MATAGLKELSKVATGGDHHDGKRIGSRGTPWLLLCIALFSWTERAHADLISLGTLSFDTSIIGASNQFVVGNLTAAEAAPPDFPVLTPLTFVNAILVLSRQGAPDETIPLGDLGPGPHPTVDYLLSVLFTEARFIATLLAPVLALAGGDTFVPVTTNITADLTASAGVLAPGDIVSIDIEGTRVPGIAEPTILVLLISGASALALTRRRRFRRLRV